MNHILHAYGFHKSGGFKAITHESIADEIESESFAWVHMDSSHDKTRQWLQTELSFLDPIILDALTEEATRPRIEVIGEGVLLILKGVNLNKNADPEDMVALRVWVDAERMITLQRRPLKAVLDFEKKLEQKQVEASAGAFLSHLVHLLTARMEPELNLVSEMLDELEEEAIEGGDSSLSEKIVSIRKKSISFKKYLTPQKEALGELADVELPWLNQSAHRVIAESYNKTARFIETLDATRERAQIVREELSSVLTEKLNKNMYILSIVAAIFLPLGFLTGLLGVNVSGIPGADDPQAFLYFCGILAVIVCLQVLTFIKLKWF